jgi:hypothetical protein
VQKHAHIFKLELESLKDETLEKDLNVIPVKRSEEPESNTEVFSGFRVKHGMTTNLS